MHTCETRSVKADALAGIYFAGSGHPGGALPCVDVLVTVLGSKASHQFFQPLSDRFVLSKGHAYPAL